jgi:hypothetical protein
MTEQSQVSNSLLTKIREMADVQRVWSFKTSVNLIQFTSFIDVFQLCMCLEDTDRKKEQRKYYWPVQYHVNTLTD